MIKRNGNKIIIRGNLVGILGAYLPPCAGFWLVGIPGFFGFNSVPAALLWTSLFLAPVVMLLVVVWLADPLILDDGRRRLIHSFHLGSVPYERMKKVVVHEGKKDLSVSLGGRWSLQRYLPKSETNEILGELRKRLGENLSTRPKTWRESQAAFHFIGFVAIISALVGAHWFVANRVPEVRIVAESAGASIRVNKREQTKLIGGEKVFFSVPASFEEVRKLGLAKVSRVCDRESSICVSWLQAGGEPLEFDRDDLHPLWKIVRELGVFRSDLMDYEFFDRVYSARVGVFLLITKYGLTFRGLQRIRRIERAAGRGFIEEYISSENGERYLLVRVFGESAFEFTIRHATGTSRDLELIDMIVDTFMVHPSECRFGCPGCRSVLRVALTGRGRLGTTASEFPASVCTLTPTVSHLTPTLSTSWRGRSGKGLVVWGQGRGGV